MSLFSFKFDRISYKETWLTNWKWCKGLGNKNQKKEEEEEEAESERKRKMSKKTLLGLTTSNSVEMANNQIIHHHKCQSTMF